MTARVLERTEWSRLPAEAAESFARISDDTRVVVVEQDGAIVSYAGLVPMWHVEGAWSREDHQKTAGAFRCLLAALGAESRALGLHTIYPGAADTDESMRAIVEGLGGVEIPMRLFALSAEARCLSR